VAVPNNAAEALERLLWAFAQSGTNKFGDAWVSVLDAQLDSVEFVQQHSAVVELVSEIQTFLESLPADDELRERHLSDMPVYYKVVVYRGDWNGAVNIGALIEPTYIRLLGALGTAIRYRGVVPVVTDTDVAKLKESLSDWEDLLNETELPEGIHADIRAQLATIHDLLGQADKLGYGPVVKEVETLFGKAVRAAKYVEDAKKVATCLGGLFEFLTHLNIGDYGSAANALVGVFSMMGDALHTAQQQNRPTKAIEGARQPALETGRNDTVDAEVVDDDEPTAES
jgi:hypothetical protein